MLPHTTLLQRGEISRRQPLPTFSLGDADGVRASEVDHAVQNLDRDGNLSIPPVLGLEPQAVADHALPTTEEGLDPRAHVVPG